eukprot:499871_1
MSLNKAIQFQHLFSQLTHKERTQFLSQLIGSHLAIILTSLFRHLSNPNQINEVTEFNELLSDIIQSRKKKPSPICTTNIKLDHFPKAIIGYMASFLPQMSYNRFNLCNRSIYLGCNSPNLLQKLDLSAVNDYSSINFTSFASVKILSIDPSKAMQSQHSQRFDSIKRLSFAPNFNDVRHLVLHGDNKRGWVQPFLNQNMVNRDTVTTLECSQYGSSALSMICMERSEFCSLLTMFPNVTELAIHRVQIPEDIHSFRIPAQDVSPIADACTKVVGLLLNEIQGHLISDLLGIFARNLKHLSLGQQDKNDVDFGGTSFDTLEELCMFYPDYGWFECILRSGSSLQKILISFCRDWMNCDEIKNGIANVMTQCIERGLFKTKKQQRKEVKIVVYVRHSDFKPKDFTFNVGRIINALETCAINDYMFIWKFIPHDGLNHDDRNTILMDLRDASMHSNVIISDSKHFKFIITNENCKLNGHEELICGFDYYL